MSYTHEYIGPATKDGLRHGVECRIERRWAGGYKIQVPGDRRHFIVALNQVKPKKRSEK